MKRPFPHMLAKRLRRIWMIGGAVQVSTLIVWVVAGHSSTLGMMAMMLYVVETAVILCIAEWYKNRFIDQARAGEHHVCPGCSYPLFGLPDKGRCPECGLEYSPQILAETWHKAML